MENNKDNQATFTGGLLYSRPWAKCVACRGRAGLYLVMSEWRSLPLLLSDSNRHDNHYDPISPQWPALAKDDHYMKFSNSSSSLEGIAGGSSHNWDSVLCGHKGTESCQVFATSFYAVTKHCFDQCTGPGLRPQQPTSHDEPKIA